MIEYSGGEIRGFAMDIIDATDLYIQAIHPSCDKTPTVTAALDRVEGTIRDFLAQDDPEQAAEDNYNENIALISAYGSIMTPAWFNDQYFQAGQFFGFIAADVIIAPEWPAVLVSKLRALQWINQSFLSTSICK